MPPTNPDACARMRKLESVIEAGKNAKLELEKMKSSGWEQGARDQGNHVQSKVGGLNSETGPGDVEVESAATTRMLRKPSRVDCLTCKIRKVKCTWNLAEEKESIQRCDACVKIKRKCQRDEGDVAVQAKEAPEGQAHKVKKSQAQALKVRACEGDKPLGRGPGPTSKTVPQKRPNAADRITSWQSPEPPISPASGPATTTSKRPTEAEPNDSDSDSESDSDTMTASTSRKRGRARTRTLAPEEDPLYSVWESIASYAKTVMKEVKNEIKRELSDEMKQEKERLELELERERLEELRQELEKEKEQLKYAQRDTRTVGAVGRRLVPVVEIVRSSGVKRGKRA